MTWISASLLIWLSLTTCPSQGRRLFSAEEQTEKAKVEDWKLAVSRGLLFGAAVGDSLGSVLEFWKPWFKVGKVSPGMSKWNTAVNLAVQDNPQGGGGYNMLPGEATDDTAMAVCLARALAELSSQGVDPAAPGMSKDQFQTKVREAVMPHYVAWLYSEPFDIGGTTFDVLNAPADTLPDPGTKFDVSVSHADRVAALKPKASLLVDHALKTSAAGDKKNIEGFSSPTQSNGCLMRCMSLAIFTKDFAYDDHVLWAVEADVTLTNNNVLSTVAVMAYVMAARHLLNNPSDTNRAYGAFDAAEQWLTKVKTQEWVTYVTNKDGDQVNAATQVLSWLEPTRLPWNEFVLSEAYFEPWTNAAGDFFYGPALQHTFYHLWHVTPYKDAIIKSIRLNGDTDTNAGIVGGMIGALHGENTIPRGWIEKVWDLEKDGKAPEFQHKWKAKKDDYGPAGKLMWDKFNSDEKKAGEARGDPRFYQAHWYDDEKMPSNEKSILEQLMKV